MPWTQSDVERFYKGLSKKEKELFVRTANDVRKRCVNSGVAEKICDGRAIRIAKSVVNKSREAFVNFDTAIEHLAAIILLASDESSSCPLLPGLDRDAWISRLTKALYQSQAIRLPPIGHPQGRYRIAPFIVQQIPTHTTYCEPWCGAAAVLFAKPVSDVEIINDLDPDLIHMFRAIKKLTPSNIDILRRQSWGGSKFRLQRLRLWRPQKSIDRLYRYLYINWFSWGGLGLSYREPVNFNIESRIARLEHARDRLQTVTITRDDAYSCLLSNDSDTTFFYCDPAFPSASISHKSMTIRIGELLNVLDSLKARFILTTLDTPEVRAAFLSYHITLLVNYKRGQRTSLRNELIISNFSLPNQDVKKQVFTVQTLK